MITPEIKDRVEKTVDKYVDENLSIVIDHRNLMEPQIFLIKHTAVDIILRRDYGWGGGRFAKAIVDDKLSHAIEHADNLCLRSLKLFVLIKLWVSSKYD